MEFFNMLCYLLAGIGFLAIAVDFSFYFFRSKRLLIKLVSALFIVPSTALALSALSHLVN